MKVAKVEDGHDKSSLDSLIFLKSINDSVVFFQCKEIYDFIILIDKNKFLVSHGFCI